MNKTELIRFIDNNMTDNIDLYIGKDTDDNRASTEEFIILFNVQKEQTMNVIQNGWHTRINNNKEIELEQFNL